MNSPPFLSWWPGKDMTFCATLCLLNSRQVHCTVSALPSFFSKIANLELSKGQIEVRLFSLYSFLLL